MLKQIFTYEMKLLRRDGIAGFTIVLFLGAIAYAGWLGVRSMDVQEAEVQTYQQIYEESIAEAKQEALEQEMAMVRDSIPLDTYSWGPRNPYSVGSSQGITITLPPGPLAAFAVGQSDLQPAALKVSVAGVRSAAPTATLENPFKLLVGHFDLSFVFLYMYPLLIIALMFGLTTSERESGLLRMLLAQPVKLSELAEGKIAARAVLLGGCILLGTGGLGLIVGGEGILQRWALWVLVAFSYGVFWVGLCVFIDSRLKVASVSALVLAGCWLVLAIVLPSLISFFATTFYPVPSRMEYVTAMRTESTLAQQQGAASLARFFEDHPEIAPVSDDDANFAMLRVAREERIAEQLAPLEARFEAQRARQQQFIGKIGYLSPTVLTHQAFMDIAGTGPDRYALFLEEAHAFHETWKSHFVPRYFEDIAFMASDYDTLPAFNRAEEDGNRLAGRVLSSVVIILLVGLVFLGLGFFRYRHQELI